ncbi:DUF4232 domain-containing protein [Streptomyces sp. NPDC048611]|uniref:DUF4232 domain-containing protein n=1 Tax=Streptomyces sp. NPDC048611 TaxID=3155635 RepID=UPI00343F9A08
MSSTTARTPRRRTLRLAVAALTAVAGLTLTACSGSDVTDAAPADKAEAGAAATSGGAGSSGGAPGSDAPADPGAKDGGKDGAKGDAKAGAAGKQSGSAQPSGGGKAGSGSRCHTSELKASFATGEDAVPDPNGEGATTTSVVLTNKGSRNCVIGGFPGVDLKAENGGGLWSLTRSSAKGGSIPLKPGDSTDFTINLGLSEDAGSWKPASAVITPPNETTSLTLDWPWGALTDQRSATHPATFVNPIG